MEDSQRLALSAEEVAERVGASRSTIYRLMDSGKLPFIETGPRGKRIPKWAVDEWVNRGRNKNAS